MTAAVFAVPAVPLLLTQFERFMQGGNIGHDYYPLSVMAQSLAFNWVLGLDGAAPGLGVLSGGSLDALRWVCVVGAIALASYGALSTGARAHTALLIAWLLVPTALVFLISQRLPVFQPRYVLWSAPALLILIAFGITGLLRARAGMAALTGIVVAVSLAGWVGQLQTPIRWDLRSAVAHIKQDLRPGDAVIFQIPLARFSFEHYLRPRGRDDLFLFEGPFVNGGMDDAELDATLNPIRAKHARIWLLQTERDKWDAEGATELWFRNHMRTSDFVEYHGATVALFEP